MDKTQSLNTSTSSPTNNLIKVKLNTISRNNLTFKSKTQISIAIVEQI